MRNQLILLRIPYKWWVTFFLFSFQRPSFLTLCGLIIMCWSVDLLHLSEFILLDFEFLWCVDEYFSSNWSFQILFLQIFFLLFIFFSQYACVNMFDSISKVSDISIDLYSSFLLLSSVFYLPALLLILSSDF
jgi:hypothetical protein